MPEPLGINEAGAVGLDEGAASVAGLDPGEFLPQMDEATFGQTVGQNKLPSLFTPPPANDMPPLSDVKGVRQKVVDEARKWVGVPYVWGGTSNNGWDCSGAMQWIFGRYGIDLPRLSAQQAVYGQRVDVNKASAGDLIAWNNGTRNGGPEAEHIALYLGDGYIFEAPRPGVASRIRKLGPNEGDVWGVHLSY